MDTLNGINIRLELDEINETLKEATKSRFLFEPNDKLTRHIVSRYVDDFIKEEIDFKVVCDERNNDAEAVATGELFVNIVVKLKEKE